MNKLQTLQNDRIAALSRAEAASATAPNGLLSTEAQATFDAAMSDVDRLDGEIVAEQAAMDAAASAGHIATTNLQRLAAARTILAPRSMQTNDAPRVTHVRNRGDADPTRGYASIGHLAMDIFRASQGAGMSPALAAIQGANQGAGSEGGFLVPPQFAATIWDGLNNPAESLLGMCDRYPIEGESISFPANAETSRATGSRYGGVRAYWVNEGGTLDKTKPKFRMLKLEPHQLGVLIPATDKLLRNAATLAPYLQRAATDEINFAVGDAIFRGTGAGQPLGILAGGPLVTVLKESGQAADTLVQANVSKMYARLHPRCRKNAVWFINGALDPQLDSLNTPVKNVAGTENVGGITNVVYNSEKQTLKGRPIIPLEYCSAIGDLGDIVLADMSMYAAGVQGGVEAAQSMHLYFDSVQTAFRFVFAVDGQPWLAAAQTPYKGSDTLTSFVTLEAR